MLIPFLSASEPYGPWEGGNNGAPHNHNHIGHFTYESGGVMLLTDLGLEEYTRDYFGPKRYARISCGSLGHSVPVVGGLDQGAEYRRGSYTAGEDGAAVLELRGAYPPGMLERFDRRFHFGLETGEPDVLDRFCLPPGGSGPILERLITQIPPKPMGNRVLLECGSVLGVVEIRRPWHTAVTVETYSRRSHLGRTEPVCAIPWEVPIQGQAAESGFCVNCRRI